MGTYSVEGSRVDCKSTVIVTQGVRSSQYPNVLIIVSENIRVTTLKQSRISVEAVG